MAAHKKAVYVNAVERKCIECLYDPDDAGTWRQQVEACTALSCALFDIRPLPKNATKRG